MGGNPPFSVLIEKIIFEEDATQIIDFLQDQSLIKGKEVSIYSSTITTGKLLIPQVSEYTAYYIANKLRHLSCQIKVALSNEIFESSQYHDNSAGILTKKNIFQDKTLQGKNKSKKNILISNENIIDGMKVKYYLNLVTANKIHKMKTSSENKNFHEESYYNLSEEQLDEIYEELLVKIKDKANEINANAIIGITYDTRIISQTDLTVTYKITCIGNAVWLEKEPLLETFTE